MRITCPNCGAQYEVDARVIPDMGRDVQCSNCGHTWFQRPQSAVAASVRRVVEDPPVSPGPELEAAPRPVARDDGGATIRAAEMFPPISPDAGAPARAVPDAVAGAVADAAPVTAGAPDPGPASPGTPASAAAAASDMAETERPALDDAMRALLREEAEREVQARAAERRPAIETQGDFDLPGAAPAARSTQRSADLSGPVDDAGPGASIAAAVAAAASRRDSLPDVDTITSGLRIDPTDAQAAVGAARGGGPRRGFRAGFVIPLLFVAAAALVYVYAPTLADAVPALRGPLAGYVDSVNSLRAWIAGAVSGPTG